MSTDDRFYMCQPRKKAYITQENGERGCCRILDLEVFEFLSNNQIEGIFKGVVKARAESNISRNRIVSDYILLVLDDREKVLIKVCPKIEQLLKDDAAKFEPMKICKKNRVLIIKMVKLAFGEGLYPSIEWQILEGDAANFGWGNFMDSLGGEA